MKVVCVLWSVPASGSDLVMDTGDFFTRHRPAALCVRNRDPFRDTVEILKILQPWVLNGEYSSPVGKPGCSEGTWGEVFFLSSSGQLVLLRGRHWHQFINSYSRVLTNPDTYIYFFCFCQNRSLCLCLLTVQPRACSLFRVITTHPSFFTAA